MRKISITAGNVSATAILNETKTADAIWRALPIEERANTWGDEVYFGIPVHLDEDASKEVVQMGDLGYWPPGHALCIFFGRTPMSRGNEIRPASPVNVFGQVEGDAKVFKQVSGGARIKIERAE
ncbi:MAG: cyclophilin-like fold protein [Chloroflexota bacterium]